MEEDKPKAIRQRSQKFLSKNTVHRLSRFARQRGATNMKFGASRGMRVMRDRILLPAHHSFVLLLFLLPALYLLFSEAYAVPTHLDKSKIQTGCRTCHKGHGTRGTVLLERSKDDLCFKCHGPGGREADVYSVITKPSSHPIIQTARYHLNGEDLPERNPSTPRHVSCYDCHNVHKSEKGDSVKGVRGYSGKGAKINRLNYEYELCYRCHSDSANLPLDKNISLDFSPANPSYHPVETYGRNSFVPSLIRNYSSSSLIRCSDCHGNDGQGGAKGPHGSIYAPILKLRYERTPGPESPASYGLCYDCHNRTSILNDESFKAHKTHIVFNQTSCAQCHDSHGSRLNPNLINFDTTLVFPNTRGELIFQRSVPGKPRCFLTCHVNGRTFEHKLNQSLTYCVNTKCITDW